jgi:spore coat polysaccharide biosynthesis protein SpsF
MGSTRLPGKVLADIQGHPMLWYVVQRTRAATTLNDVMVATTTQSPDDDIVDFCGQLGVTCFRGSEVDVLDRYYQAALREKADVVIRITSDCPLIDPEIIDKVVRAFLADESDYASNSLVRTYPRGLDTEVMTFQVLEQAWLRARKPYERAHVTAYIYDKSSDFRLLSVTGGNDYSHYRWTVDTPEDLELVRTIYGRLKGSDALLNDVIQLLQREPAIADINRAISQKALHEG